MRSLSVLENTAFATDSWRVAKSAGYNASFLTMAAIAAVTLIFFWFFMPETKSTAHPVSSKSGLATFRQ